MDYDLIVAGGGPTGLWLACELALARVRVVVQERLVKPTGLSKALGLQARTMAMLELSGHPRPLLLLGVQSCPF